MPVTPGQRRFGGLDFRQLSTVHKLCLELGKGEFLVGVYIGLLRFLTRSGIGIANAGGEIAGVGPYSSGEF